MKYRKLKTIWAAMRRDLGYSEAEVERALDLEQGTIKEAIESGKPSPELFTLFKIMYTYPWMIKVADRNYDPKYAMREMAVRAVDILVEANYP